MKFKEWVCLVEPAHYGNGRKALVLNEKQPPHERIAVATVNLVGDICPDDCAFIKDYSENDGMTSALQIAGLIESPAIRFIHSGHVIIGLYRLTEKALDLFK
jgi:hypothetical protein